MFVGSDKCKGKSTLLMQLFEEQPFNVGAQQMKNTLHSSCVDLIFLGEKHKCNYHVIDVHGKLNDPFFLHCTNNKISKIDAIVRLAKFCHCIVLQVTKTQFQAKKTKNDLFGIQPDKCPEMEELLKKLKVLELYFSLIKKKKFFLNNNEAPKCQIALVVKDCKVMKANSKSTDNIFYSPKRELKNKLEYFENCVSDFAKRLFETGIPIEFCDGDQSRMSDDFISKIFDSEGVGAPEKISDQKEADSGTKKDNKIILGSLASSRVFILNFMRSGNICSIRQLADIKF
ncbi:hypothetical protein RFI_00586, partial [Reticulomyxa filosa]